MEELTLQLRLANSINNQFSQNTPHQQEQGYHSQGHGSGCGHCQSQRKNGRQGCGAGCHTPQPMTTNTGNIFYC
eukprot:2626649-Ditylum_brightwellii.AAC.1